MRARLLGSVLAAVFSVAVASGSLGASGLDAGGARTWAGLDSGWTSVKATPADSGWNAAEAVPGDSGWTDVEAAALPGDSGWTSVKVSLEDSGWTAAPLADSGWTIVSASADA